MDNYLKYLYGNDIFKITIKYVLENNPSWNNPYHNNSHILDVFNNAMKMSYIYDLDKQERNILGISALFHDYGHSGGSKKDNENISTSKKELIKFIKNELYELENDLDSIVNLIEITEFPHKRKPTTISEKILIDADLISVFLSNDWFNGIVIALSKELNNSILEQIDMQFGFIENLELYTDYAKKIQNEHTDRILSELKFLKNTFN